MATAGQIRGMLLEEAILVLLRGSGYETVRSAGIDRTLRGDGASIYVHGRGADHQIDAIADFHFPPPFGHPHRLLVEAKCEANAIGLGVVRNALGVLRDVSEYWQSRRAFAGPNEPPRWHYQMGIFSTSGFTKPAQRFAYAQDIFLLDLSEASFFQPVVESIEACWEAIQAGLRPRRRHELSGLRRQLRDELEGWGEAPRRWHVDARVADYVDKVRGIGNGLLGMAGGRLPLLLVPGRDVDIANLEGTTGVRIFWDEGGWYLRDAEPPHHLLFSFGLPGELFRKYAQGGGLRRARALDLKEEMLGQIVAVVADRGGGPVRFVEFILDKPWLQAVRDARG